MCLCTGLLFDPEEEAKKENPGNLSFRKNRKAHRKEKDTKQTLQK